MDKSGHGELEKSTNEILQKELHKITLYYFQYGGGSAIKAECQEKGMERQPLKNPG